MARFARIVSGLPNLSCLTSLCCESRFGALRISNRRFEVIRTNRSNVMTIGGLLRIDSSESPRSALRTAGQSKDEKTGAQVATKSRMCWRQRWNAGPGFQEKATHYNIVVLYCRADACIILDGVTLHTLERIHHPPIKHVCGVEGLTPSLLLCMCMNTYCCAWELAKQQENG